MSLSFTRMWVVQGIQGSKLRRARKMSIPLYVSGDWKSSIMGVLRTASSYGPGVPQGVLGAAFRVEGVRIW